MTQAHGDPYKADGAGQTAEDNQIAVEQLRVAEEQLRVQNEELRVNREAAEAALQRYHQLFDLAPDPYITTDSGGAIREANAAASRLLNVGSERLEGMPLAAFIPAGRRRSFRVGLVRIARGEEPVPGADEWTVLIKPRRGEPVEVAVTVGTVRDSVGNVETIRWLLRDVTARRRAEAEVRSLNAELERRVAERTAALEAANWAKAEFLSVMAHELRTPLNAIIGYAELLEMGIPGPVSEGQIMHLSRIRSSGQRLIGLVNEVLDLGKVEAGQLRVVREECAMSDAIEAALSLVAPQAAGRGIGIVNDCCPEPPLMYLGDQNRVEQIIINLLSNAIKFTEAGGEVTIECRMDMKTDAELRTFDIRHPWLALRVRDTGIGMSSEALQRVFDPFVQVERPLTRTRGGTGLGLTISRRLARLMGGDLTAQSTPGLGSTFTLWLPGTSSPEVEKPEELERRAPARYAQGIAELGSGLLERLDTIVVNYSRRLSAKGGIAKARSLTRSELEDHAAAFLADIVQALVAIEDAQGGPSGVMRDGSVLRRIISERHGAQRQRLGWGEPDLRAEFRILRRCVLQEAKKVPLKDSSPDAAVARKAGQVVLTRLLDTAEEISVRGFRLASMDELQNNRESR
ncbi:MAG TPA: PAS domain-containing sensor histidine kinase [Gemmatimonadaceae bacterium]|nr:PAS domain-containing sensor histidine kinase [Gemmatimonadaceae bacterium]